jgi:hypothetical protein
MLRYLPSKELAIDHDQLEVKHGFVNDHRSMQLYSSYELKYTNDYPNLPNENEVFIQNKIFSMILLFELQ